MKKNWQRLSRYTLREILEAKPHFKTLQILFYILRIRNLKENQFDILIVYTVILSGFTNFDMDFFTFA